MASQAQRTCQFLPHGRLEPRGRAGQMRGHEQPDLPLRQRPEQLGVTVQERPELDGHLAGDAVEKDVRAPVARVRRSGACRGSADLPRARGAEGQMRAVPRPAGSWPR